ncbi:MAG: metallophosphoesterase, partial [Eubacteriales bacterium]
TLDLISGLGKIAPIYAVSGNHDLWNPDFKKNQSLLAGAGAILLENTSQTVQRGADSIRICGITDPNTLDETQATACTQAYMQRVQASGGYDILLYHRANLLDLFAGSGYELILSGHLHGGQVRLPGFGGIVSPEGRAFPKYGGGVYAIGNGCTAVVSRGLGNTAIFPRIYDAPELVLVTLHCK